MSLLRCALCNVLAPLVDRLCSKCIDVVEAYLDAEYCDTPVGEDTDYIPGSLESDDSDGSVDLDDLSEEDIVPVDSSVEDEKVVDHIPDAAPPSRK